MKSISTGKSKRYVSSLTFLGDTELEDQSENIRGGEEFVSQPGDTVASAHSCVHCGHEGNNPTSKVTSK
jgi:hypothetical protein